MALNADVRQSAEYGLDKSRRFRGRLHAALDDVCMIGEQSRQSAFRPVLLQSELPMPSVLNMKIAMQQHQAVLDQRELILAAAGVSDQPLGQLARDFPIVQYG